MAESKGHGLHNISQYHCGLVKKEARFVHQTPKHQGATIKRGDLRLDPGLNLRCDPNMLVHGRT
jgi:hypothetical protein